MMQTLNVVSGTSDREKNDRSDKEWSGMRIVAFIVLLSLFLFSLAMAGAYYRDNIQSPSGNEHSVPASRNY